MSDAVQQIKDRLNIIDVISPYVELHKAGRHFKARCPFHNEKTPSFNVSPERGMYHCYGCQAGGDIFTFIQEIEKVDFKEALKILAEKANVELTPVSPEKKGLEDRMYSALEKATAFYESNLEPESEVRKYLEKRGVTTKTIATWRLGFAPGPPSAGWRVTKEHLTAQKFTEEELKKVGLIKGGEDGKQSYDVFRNRVMFPIFDQSGRPVAFSGRTLEKGDDIPKYVNSPETELFKKSEILYGYHKAKHGIRQLGFSLIVEGQFDVVMSHQAGYANTVAVSGTALTTQHVQMLERLSDKVVLALDADRAGVAAVKKAADLMLRRGLDVKVAVMPEGTDPADMIQNDPKQFKNTIGHSLHVIEFLLLVLQKENLPERTFKLRAREEVIPYLALLPNKIDQDHFEGVVAEKLHTTKDAIHYELERLEEKTGHEKDVYHEETKVFIKNEKPNIDKNLYKTTMTYLIGVIPILENNQVIKVKKILEDITKEKIEDLEKELDQSTLSGVTFRAEAMVDQYPKKVFEGEVVHALNQLKEVVIKSKLNENRQKMLEAERLGESEKVMIYMTEVGKLQQEKQKPNFDESILK
ncbi:MAG: DNA primase [Candidatus Paceibacterota bacterium]